MDLPPIQAQGLVEYQSLNHGDAEADWLFEPRQYLKHVLKWRVLRHHLSHWVVEVQFLKLPDQAVKSDSAW